MRSSVRLVVCVLDGHSLQTRWTLDYPVFVEKEEYDVVI